MKQWLRLLLLALCLGTFAQNAMAQCVGGSMSGEPVLFKTTGNAVLDATTNAEANALHRVFGLTPTLYTMDDSQSKNAFADCTNNRVMIGLRLLSEELWNSEHGELAVAGIMAHEFAHMYQCSRGGTLKGKNLELQADYLAGWYLKWEKGVHGLDASGFARSVWSLGDEDFTSPYHHGTPAERVQATVAGYNDASTNVASAYAKALAYLQGDNAPTPTPTTPTPKPVPQVCERQVPCTHMTTCQHPVACKHPVACQHTIPCQHPVQCQHPIPCQHPVPCQHAVATPWGLQPAHQADPMHNADPAHGADPQHDFDTVHKADPAHNADPTHVNGDPMHGPHTEQYPCSQ